MPLPFHQIDAFSDRPFAGNPAVVYRLDHWLEDGLMQQIAAEHNLAETAFVVKEGAAWRIRWFTPTIEVPLCGHATLASAHALFECHGEPGERIDFNYVDGTLAVDREGDRLVLDLACNRHRLPRLRGWQTFSGKRRLPCWMRRSCSSCSSHRWLWLPASRI